MENLDRASGKDLSGAGTNQVTDSLTEFVVSEVPQADKPLPEVPYYEAVEELLNTSLNNLQVWREYRHILGYCEQQEALPPKQPKRTIESCSQYRGRLVAHIEFHPLIAATHAAFNDHRPLCLSPDLIWLSISQGLANHINANAEQLRSQFVKHEGKLEIAVRRDDFIKGTPENPWSEVFGEFSAAIRQHIGEATHDLLMPTFSTTGLVEKAAAEIVLMDAMQSYIDYLAITRCGIPKIKLEGTIADWQELLERTKGLAQFDLQWWIELLIPILEQFILAVQGKPNRHFWQSMYKFNNSSGGPYITGWIIAFFPYLKNKQTQKATEPNRWLLEREKQQKFLYPVGKSKSFVGLKTHEFPSGLAKVPFIWLYEECAYDMEFLGGFVGVKQNSNDLSLRPEIGWAVREVVAA